LNSVVLKRLFRRHYKRILVIFSFAMLIPSMWYTGIFLYKTSQIQKWSPEVNASVVNLVSSVITSIMMISVTIYFNTKTQKMTVETQKMNYDAMKFQARATIRDKILEKRMELYPEILDEITDIHFSSPIIRYYFLEDTLCFQEYPSRTYNSFQEYIKGINRKLRNLDNYTHNPFVSGELKEHIRNFVMVKQANFKMSSFSGAGKKIISVDSYCEEEIKYYSLISKQIEGELQLGEVERDIKSLKYDDYYFYDRLNRMI
jgi:hypothetical protein